MPSSDPFFLEFEYPTGQPEDLWVARDPSWIGIAVGFRRTHVETARMQGPEAGGGRKFLDRAGVYLLRGKDPLTGSVLLRVGEGGAVSTRIQSHDRDLPWWAEAVAVISGGDGWDSGQIKHFEAELYRRAVDAKRCVLMNGNQPQGGNLSGAKKTSANSLVDEIERRLRAAGYPEFHVDAKKPARVPRTKKRKNPPAQATTLAVSTPPQNRSWPAGAEVRIDRKGIVAYARRGRGKQLMVLEGSQAVSMRTRGCPDYIVAERREIWGRAAEEERTAPLRFERNRLFKSPSAAAGVVLGHAANGNVEWRSPDGTPLSDLKHR